MNIKDIKFTTYLSIISILGFVAIMVQSALDVNIDGWVNSAMFILIGLSLFISGGYHLVFSYFKGGLTVTEVNRIVTVIVGISSIFVGLMTSPIFKVENPIINGVKLIISGIAVVVILLEMVVKNN